MAANAQTTGDLIEALGQLGRPSLILNREGRVTWQNDAGRELFGDLVGEPAVERTVAPEHTAAAHLQFDRKLRGVAYTDYEIEVITRHGRRVRAEISSVAIPGDDPERAVFALAWIEPESPLPSDAGLTPRQHEVLDLLAEGASTEQIAGRLHLSTETVRNHVRHLLKALGAHSRLEAVVVARRQGLIRGDERK
jgi:DNA-binding CsgD family transcriptional regulator